METRIKTVLDGFRKSVLDAHGMDFLIVGSLALHELGMETGETSRHRHGSQMYTRTGTEHIQVTVGLSEEHDVSDAGEGELSLQR